MTRQFIRIYLLFYQKQKKNWYSRARYDVFIVWTYEVCMKIKYKTQKLFVLIYELPANRCYTIFFQMNFCLLKRTIFGEQILCVSERYCCLFCCSTNENSSVYMKSNIVGGIWYHSKCYVIIDSMQRNLFDVIYEKEKVFRTLKRRQWLFVWQTTCVWRKLIYFRHYIRRTT